MRIWKSLFAKPRAIAVMWSSLEFVAWNCHDWETVFFPFLDRIVSRSPDEGSVICRQLKSDGDTEIKFPKLVWSIDSSASWCWDTTEARAHNDDAIFVNLQITKPTMQVLRRNGSVPDIFVQIQGIPVGTNDRSRYDQLLLAVFSPNFHAKNLDLPQLFVDFGSEIASAIVLTSDVEVSHLNEMESIARDYLFYRGMTMDTAPDLDKCRAKWQWLKKPASSVK